MMLPYWLPSLLFATSISAKAAFAPRGLPPSSGTGFYPTGTRTPIYPSGTVKSYSYHPTCSYPLYTTGTGSTHFPTGTGSAYSTYTTVTPSTSYTPPPPPPPSSTSSLPPATPSTFKIQIIVEYDNGPEPPGINNSYAYVRPIQPGEDGYTGDDGVDSLFITPSFALASVFHLNADHTLTHGIEVAGNDVNAPGEPGGAYRYYLFESPAKIAATGGAYEKSVCSINNGYLGCQTGINYLDFTCGEKPFPFQIESGPTERPYEDFCYPLGLKTVPVLGPLV